jgi:hypothetical protein
MATHRDNVQALTAARQRVIAQAVAARKISADRADDYRRLFDADPRGITRLLTARPEDGGLMAGMNVGGDPFPTPAADYPREWLQGQTGAPSGTVAFDDNTTRLDALTHPGPHAQRRARTPTAPLRLPVPGGTRAGHVRAVSLLANVGRGLLDIEDGFAAPPSAEGLADYADLLRRAQLRNPTSGRPRRSRSAAATSSPTFCASSTSDNRSKTPFSAGLTSGD